MFIWLNSWFPGRIYGMPQQMVASHVEHMWFAWSFNVTWDWLQPPRDVQRISRISNVLMDGCHAKPLLWSFKPLSVTIKVVLHNGRRSTFSTIWCTEAKTTRDTKLKVSHYQVIIHSTCCQPELDWSWMLVFPPALRVHLFTAAMKCFIWCCKYNNNNGAIKN